MRKAVLLLGLIAVLSMLLSGVAFAAAPQNIYDDFADNEVLDGTYTDAELRAYLNDATLHQYPPDASKTRQLDSLTRGMLSSRDRFPFTGTEVAWVAIGVTALLVIGLGLRRATKQRV